MGEEKTTRNICYTENRLVQSGTKQIKRYRDKQKRYMFRWKCGHEKLVNTDKRLRDKTTRLVFQRDYVPQRTC